MASRSSARESAPLPLAVNSAAYNGRAPCIWDGWCDSGCPIGALANPATVHLPRAAAKGATLVTDATVVKVLTNADGTASHRCRSCDQAMASASRCTRRLSYSQRTPLRIRDCCSRQRRQAPAGLGNANDLVGSLRDDAHGRSRVRPVRRGDAVLSRARSAVSSSTRTAIAKRTHDKSGAFGSYQWMIAQAVKPNDLLGVSTSRVDLFGRERCTIS